MKFGRITENKSETYNENSLRVHQYDLVAYLSFNLIDF